MFHLFVGKYRFLVVSISLFLIFDLGVLVLNFYTSGKISAQAELINLAGNQRTLTQQMSKATLYIKSQKLQSWVYQSGLEELREHYRSFDKSLKILNEGGTVLSSNTGLPISIEATTSAEGKNILAQTNRLWAGFYKVLSPMMIDVLITDEEIQPASTFIAANNLELFGLMDALTEHFKASAERQTTFLRRAQVIGISLATINFFIILFHFLRKLRGLDKQIQIKQHESDQILNTISEGMFLLDDKMRMSGQHSQQLTEIFATDRISGRHFEKFLTQFFPKKVVATSMDFVGLYFRDHIDPTLIDDVNPLKRAEALVVQKTGGSEKKFLDFSFARLGQGGDEPYSILVSVKDVSAAILLEEQDQQVNDDMDQQVALLTQILPIPKMDLDSFIAESNAGFSRINELLKDTKNIKDNYQRTLTRIARETHKLKGNAAALGLDKLTQHQHDFEDAVQQLQGQTKQRKISGRDLLPLTMRLKENYEYLDVVSELREKLGNYSSVDGMKFLSSSAMLQRSDARPVENQKWFALNDFAQQLSGQEGACVDVHMRGFNNPLDEGLSEVLYPMAVQLLRNSIAHGVESRLIRTGLKKPNCGQVTISISHDKRNNYRFLFEDDGCGFDYEAIRLDLIAKGLVGEKEAGLLGHTALVQHAFKDAVSTRSQVDQIAGRGVGLPLVWQQIRLLKGKLKIRSVQHEFTQFIVDFQFEEHNKESSSVNELRRAG